MAIIFSYPKVSASDLNASDRFILSKMNQGGNPTKSVSLSDLANFITTTGTGTGTTNAVVKWADGPGGLLGDSSIEDTGSQINVPYTLSINNATSNADGIVFPHPAGGASANVNFYFAGAGVGSRFVISRGATGGPEIELESGGNVNINRTGNGNFFVGGEVTFDDYGSGTITGTPTFNLEVDANGNVIETASTVGIPWPYQYDAANENFVQGEAPTIVGTGNTGYGVSSLPILDAGQNNTAFGANTGLNLENSSDNVIIGYDAGRNLKPGGNTCDRNTLVGSGITFSLNPSGDDNTCVGYRAGSNIDSGFQNVFMGVDAGRSNSLGADNVAIGYKALEIQGGSSRNIAIGSLALTAAQSGAFYNTAIGYEAGTAITNGDYNVLLGYQAGSTITTGSDNICIGYTSQPSSLTVSNEITIGNTNNDKFRLPGLQVSASDGDVLTYKAATGTISFNSNRGNTIINGLVNNLGSAGSGGYDFMEWVSNITSSTQIPVMKTPRALTLRSLSYAWMGDTALSIGVGEQVAFTIGTIPSGSNPVIGNYTSVLSLFDLTNADDGTYANGVVSGLSQVFNIGDMIGVVGQETGTVTPNNGELSITFEFEIN